MPGTYQATEAPAGEETSVLVQPVRSVLAKAREACRARRGKERMEMWCIVGFDEADGFVIVVVVVVD